MECELNPRIPYTELSHIIKRQKEVRVHTRPHSAGGELHCAGKSYSITFVYLVFEGGFLPLFWHLKISEIGWTY